MIKQDTRNFIVNNKVTLEESDMISIFPYRVGDLTHFTLFCVLFLLTTLVGTGP